jgi:2-oxo-4-hydroxy-4-carboxy-5-ureidoimidazoline decarboxylase
MPASASPAPHSTGAPAAFNALPPDDAEQRLMTCLGVRRWAREVAAGRPYASGEDLVARATRAADSLTDLELDAALAGHPRIGEQASAPEHQADFSEREQSGVDPTDAAVAADLLAGNAAYEARFDRVFIIRAAGRSAGEILSELRRRLQNDDASERVETVTQLREIAVLRLKEML